MAVSKIKILSVVSLCVASSTSRSRIAARVQHRSGELHGQNCDSELNVDDRGNMCGIADQAIS